MVNRWFWDSFTCILLHFKKAYAQNSHIFTRPPNIHITPFHTKNNFKSNNLKKKPSHTNNLHKKLSSWESFLLVYFYISKEHTRKTHTFLPIPQTHTQPLFILIISLKSNILHKKPSHTNNMHYNPSHTPFL